MQMLRWAELSWGVNLALSSYHLHGLRALCTGSGWMKSWTGMLMSGFDWMKIFIF